MIPPALKNTIEQLLSQGKSIENIRLELVKEGWPKNVIETALQLQNSHAISQAQEPASENKVFGQFSSNVSASGSIPTPPQQYGIKSENKSDNYFFKIMSGEKKFRVFLASLLIGLILSIYPSYQAIKFGLPFVKNLEKRVITIIDEVFPEELEITIEKGRARTNVSEPYHLTMNISDVENFFQIDNETNKPISKIRILTLNTNGMIEDFDKYQTMAMLTSQNLVYYGNEGVQITSLSSFPDMQINKTFILDKINEVNKDQKIVKFLTTIIYLSPLFLILIITIYYLSNVLWGSFIIWIASKAIQANISYGKLYGLTGLIYLLPFLMQMGISYIPSLAPFSIWINTATDVVVISFVYVLISRFKNENKLIEQKL